MTTARGISVPDLTVVTPPAEEVITAKDVREIWTKQSDEADDPRLGRLAVTATSVVERMLGTALIERTYDLHFDGEPPKVFEFPYPPFVSLTSITYYDSEEDSAAFDLDDVYMQTRGGVGALKLRDGVIWGVTTLRPINTFVFRFIAGYSAKASKLPEEIVTGIGMLVAHWFDTGKYDIPESVHALLQPWRRKSFF